ncbi:MAG: hypothetical protein ABR548_00060 [Actinomycetota bacterium]|nr:hypothetical protein [Actinomycetota bacterium]
MATKKITPKTSAGKTAKAGGKTPATRVTKKAMKKVARKVNRKVTRKTLAG